MKIEIVGDAISIELKNGSTFKINGDEVMADTEMYNHEIINALRATKEIVSTMRDIREILAPNKLAIKSPEIDANGFNSPPHR